MIVETVQGDAGIRIPDTAGSSPGQHLPRNGAMFILDEIQCGMGRTGTTWAFSQFEVVPDILCMGKALGGGMPVGAIATCTHRMSHWPTLPRLDTSPRLEATPWPAQAFVGPSRLEQVDMKQVETRCQHWQGPRRPPRRASSSTHRGLHRRGDGARGPVSQAVTAGLQPAHKARRAF